MSAPHDAKLQVKWTMFGSLAKGGYFRTFESVSHPGITGFVRRETAKTPIEEREFFFNDVAYKKPSEAIEAWEKFSKSESQL